LPSTDAIDRWEKIHTRISQFKGTSLKCASFNSTRFLQKKNANYFSLETSYLLNKTKDSIRVKDIWKGKYRSTDNTTNWRRRRKLIPKMKRSPDKRHTQTHGSLTEIF
jgi:hypothetical protein